MGFLRVVEVLPPLFPVPNSSRIEGPRALEEFVEEVRSIRAFADVILVAGVKDPALLRDDPVQSALLLRRAAGVDAAPVVVVRDQNRPRFLATMFSALSSGLGSIMIAWGDDYPPGAGASNVRDYPSLASAVKEAATIRKRARSTAKFFVPVNLQSLRSASGAAMAKGRVKAGADLLLAQPPTTDAHGAFDDHLSLIARSGVRDKVLLNVFHFKGGLDLERYERKFGWRLPSSLRATARKGERALIQAEREVIRRARSEGLPGIYVSTRGEPQVARALLK